MMRLSILLQNEIEIANVAVEIFLIFLYFSLLCKRKIKKIISHTTAPGADFRS